MSLEGKVSLGKQAKTLSKGQVEAVLGYLAKTRWPTRNRLIFLLSAKAGLRAKEIARLTWRMVNDSQGEVGTSLYLLDVASKGKSGRIIPLNDELRSALIEYREEVLSFAGPFVISTERALGTSPQMIVNLFHRWYRHLGARSTLEGAPSECAEIGRSAQRSAFGADSSLAIVLDPETWVAVDTSCQDQCPEPHPLTLHALIFVLRCDQMQVIPS